MPPDDHQTWRTFLAIDLPPHLRPAIDARLRELEVLGSWLRINPLDRIHLTLHFLGEVLSSDLDPVTDRTSAVVETFRAFDVEVRGVGAFRSSGRPRVVWAGIAGEKRGALIRLQAEIGVGLIDSGRGVEKRPFEPHLTLARARREPRAAEREAFHLWQEDWSDALLGSLPVRAVTLYRSELSTRPPRYTRLREFRLQ